MGSTVQMDDRTGREMQKRIQAGWGTWRKITTVLCDQSATKAKRQAVQGNGKTSD